MKKQWIKKTIVMSLAAITILGSTVYAQQGKSRNTRSSGAWMTEMNLTTEQQAQINEIRDDFQPAIMEIRHQIKKMEAESDRLSRDAKKNRKRINKLKKSIADNETAIQNLQATHREQINALLTPDQQAIYADYGVRGEKGQGFGKRSNDKKGMTPNPGRGNGRNANR